MHSHFQWFPTYVISRTSCPCKCHVSETALISQHLIMRELFHYLSFEILQESEKFCPHTLNSPEIYSISPFSRRRDSFCLKCKQTFSYTAGAENFFLLEQVSVSPSPPSPMSGHLTTPDPAVCLPNFTLVTQCIRVKCLRNRVFIISGIFCY